MIPSPVFLVTGIAVAAAMSAVLAAVHGAATEFGLKRLRHRARTNEGSEGLPTWLPDPDRVLLILQILNPLAKLVAVTFWVGLLRSVRPDASWAFLFWATLAGMGFVLVVLADALPRAIGRWNSEPTLRLLGPPLRVLAFPLLPLAAALSRMRRRMKRPSPDPQSAASRAEEEIRVIVEGTEDSRQLPHEERRMLQGVIDFSDQMAREVMTPRIDIVAVEDTEPVDGLVQTITESGFSRIPVYHETIDRVTGILVARDLFGPLSRGELDAWTELARPPLFVPETSPIATIFAEFRRRQTHLAIVVDEYGGTAGLITIEDLLEEIVGEIEDEHDHAPTELIRREPSGTFLVEARCPIDDARDELGLDLPTDENYDTIGGFVFQALGRVPRPGESIEVGASRLLVESADGRRIHRLRVAPTEDLPEDADG